MKFPVEEILNLPDMKVLDCLRVASRREEFEGIGIVITIEKSVNYCSCPNCEIITQSIHQNHWRTIHDFPWSEKTVLLKINRRQFKLSDEEVESMLRSQVSKILNINLIQVKRLGIDEIALVKGQGNYLAILVNLDTHKPIEIVKSRRIEEIREVLVCWGIQILEQIEEVSIDLCFLYKNLVEDLMPNANITADRFHVMKQVNDELDAMRSSEKKAAMSLEDKSEKDIKLK